MPAPRKHPEELRERTIQMTRDARKDRVSRPGGCARIGDQLGINPETLRGWVTQADAGDQPGTTTSDAAKLAELERENRELRRANAILRSASAFFAGGARPPLPVTLTTSSCTRTSSESSRSAPRSPAPTCRSLRAPSTAPGPDRRRRGQRATRNSNP